MPRVKVVGYMDVRQFEDGELDGSRPSGLTEVVENDLVEEFSTDLDDVSMILVDDDDNESETPIDDDDDDDDDDNEIHPENSQ